jgi:hypothetical protein
VNGLSRALIKWWPEIPGEGEGGSGTRSVDGRVGQGALRSRVGRFDAGNEGAPIAFLLRPPKPTDSETRASELAGPRVSPRSRSNWVADPLCITGRGHRLGMIRGSIESLANCIS